VILATRVPRARKDRIHDYRGPRREATPRGRVSVAPAAAPAGPRVPTWQAARPRPSGSVQLGGLRLEGDLLQDQPLGDELDPAADVALLERELPVPPVEQELGGAEIGEEAGGSVLRELELEAAL